MGERLLLDYIYERPVEFKTTIAISNEEPIEVRGEG